MTDFQFVERVPDASRFGDGFHGKRYDATGKGKRQLQAAKLRAQPGVWARVETTPTPSIASCVARRLKDLGCEAARRGCVVYARWPEESA